jgi:hypothetical protein
VTLKRGGNVKYRPHAFTEQGVAMSSSVLRSERAVRVNVEIMRAFVRMRQMLAAHADLPASWTPWKRSTTPSSKVVFDAIRQLMAPTPQPKRGKIGFGRDKEV